MTPGSFPTADSSPVANKSEPSKSQPETAAQVPARPATSSTAYMTDPYSSNSLGYNSSAIGGAAISPYSSPYGAMSPYGSYGSGYGGAYSGGMYGSAGGMYGGGRYGSGMGMGYGGYGAVGYGGRPGSFGMQQGQNEMMPGYQSAFQSLDQIVQAFGGFANVLDSTLMATHSSFMAMMSLADQYTHLKHFMADLMSVFSVVSLYKRIRGTQSIGSGNMTAEALEKFNPATDQQALSKRKISRTPILIFLFVVFGLPYLLNRLMHRLAERRNQMPQLDSENIRFAKALYDFDAQNPQEISFKRGDLLACLSPDSQNPWWKGKKRQGTVGYFPANYVELVNVDPSYNSQDQSVSAEKADLKSEMDMRRSEE